jgi:hypothetical protein
VVTSVVLATILTILQLICPKVVVVPDPVVVVVVPDPVVVVVFGPGPVAAAWAGSTTDLTTGLAHFPANIPLPATTELVSTTVFSVVRLFEFVLVSKPSSTAGWSFLDTPFFLSVFLLITASTYIHNLKLCAKDE